MSKATKQKLIRKKIRLDRYISKAAEEKSTVDDEEEDGEGSDNAWLTKLKHADVAILDQISTAPRLSEIVLQGYSKRVRGARQKRAASIPKGENPAHWEKKLVAGYGVKVGGAMPNAHPGWPVIKARSVYPDGVSGDAAGKWDGDPATVDTVRFYGWKGVGNEYNTFIVRNIAYLPIFTRHPAKNYVTNTVYIFRLENTFLLNTYSLSRVIGWFMAKTARTAVVQKFYSTFLRRNYLRLPLPPKTPKRFGDKLQDLGAKIIALDQELAKGDQILIDYCDESGGRVKPLSKRTDLIHSGILPNGDAISWPDKEEDWSNVEASEEGERIVFIDPLPLVSDQPAQTATGLPCEIKVKDAKLRRWLAWYANDTLASGKLPSKAWFTGLPIPDDAKEAAGLVDRIEAAKAKHEFDQTLTKLDDEVSRAFGLSASQRDYIISEMKTDPLLSHLRPNWRHKLRRRA